MSAIRTSSHSRASRANQLPYARPLPKKSSWSITGFLRYLNPLRSRSPVELPPDSSDESDVSQESSYLQQSPALSLSQRGHQMARDRQHPVTPSQRPSQACRSPPHPSHTSSVDQIETVSAHLKESLGSEGVEKLVTLLQKGSSAEAPEPFRFSTSPSTPARGNSPNGFGFTFGTSGAQTPTTSPRKTLNKNPNGVYRWQGGGSAKTPRTKNRYSSPAFGSPRSTPGRLILGDAQPRPEMKADSKRRKVVDGTGDSSTRSGGSVLEFPMRSAAPEPSPTRARQAIPFPYTASPVTPRTSNGVSPNSNPLPSTSRLRIPPKPTAPSIPSPLRQAWSSASPSSQPDQLPVTPPPPKQTKTANFMTELIKEVTPPKRPDLSNPYQTASPVKKANAKPKSRSGRRNRATGKPTAPILKDNQSKGDEPEPEKVYSPQAIIEATLPKGSKRSRPPSHLEKPSSLDRKTLPLVEEQALIVDSNNDRTSSQSKSRAAYVVEEIDEDAEDPKRANKKPKAFSEQVKKTNGQGSTTSLGASDMAIEEIEEFNADNAVEKPRSVISPPPQPPSGPSLTSLPARPAFPGLMSKSTSIPKEPSKLRFSYQPEHPGSPAPSPPLLPFVPVVSPAAAHSSVPESDIGAVVEEPQKPPIPARQAALSAPKDSLPSYTFSHVVDMLPSSSSQLQTRQAVELLPKSSLPTFDFSDQAFGASAASAPTSISSTTKAFDWAAAGVKPPFTSNSATNWTCSTCMLFNSVSATDKCTICDAPRPDLGKSAPIVKPFDWAAAGGKPPATGSDGTSWTCSTCMLSNPASAKDKCTICDAPR